MIGMKDACAGETGARRCLTLLASLIGVASLTIAGLLAGAGTASAAPDGRIVAVVSDGAVINVVFAATGLSAGQSIDPTSVVMKVGGTSIPSEAKAVGSEGSQAPVAVLTMDISGSMQGARLTAAKRAANEFLRTVPASSKVGLVTFSDTARERVRPTTDRRAVADVIAGLTAQGDTALYDATVLSTRTVGTTGPRTIVLFSDGADTSSKADLRGAQAAVKSSGTVLDAVSLGTDAAQVAALNGLAASGNGQVITTTKLTQLTAAFTEAARDITNQLTIVGKVPADLLGTAGNVTITAQGGDTSVSDSAFVSIPTAAPDETVAAEDFGPVAVESATSPFSNPLVIALGALLIFVGLATILTFALRSSTASERREQRVTRKLSIYTLSGRSAVQTSETTTMGDSNVARSAVDLANRVVVNRNFESMLSLRLERAAIPLKSGEWLLIHVGITLGAALFLLLISGGSLLASMIGLAFGVLIPLAFLSNRESRRKNAFLEQMPETLQLIAGSLSSGYSLPQAIDAVVQDTSPPMSTEFNRALIEARLGVPIEDALDNIAERMQSVDFSWVVMAIRIQREVGGNLAELLTTVAATMRERERLRRQVEVLSAEGRLSAWILGALPVVFALYLLLTRPEYLQPLYTTLLGWVLLVVAGIQLTVGALWLSKTVKVEV